MNRLIYNAIRTPDGTVLESRHRWDFKDYIDANGCYYMVDGGMDYIRRSATGLYKELSLTIGVDSHEAIREEVTWGTYGVLGDQPISYVKLKDMSTEHIENCLEDVPNMHPNYREAFENELKYREEHEIT